MRHLSSGAMPVLRRSNSSSCLAKTVWEIVDPKSYWRKSVLKTHFKSHWQIHSTFPIALADRLQSCNVSDSLRTLAIRSVIDPSTWHPLRLSLKNVEKDTIIILSSIVRWTYIRTGIRPKIRKIEPAPIGPIGFNRKSSISIGRLSIISANWMAPIWAEIRTWIMYELNKTLGLTDVVVNQE